MRKNCSISPVGNDGHEGFRFTFISDSVVGLFMYDLNSPTMGGGGGSQTGAKYFEREIM